MIKLLLAIALEIGINNPKILYGICSTESDFRNVINHNDGGSPSYGICQIKLSTAKMMIPSITAEMLMEPIINAYVAGLYIKYQENRINKLREHNLEYTKIKGYGVQSCIISAYNAGRCIHSNQDTYVKKVYKRMEKYEEK